MNWRKFVYDDEGLFEGPLGILAPLALIFQRDKIRELAEEDGRRYADALERLEKEEEKERAKHRCHCVHCHCHPGV